MNGPIGFHGPTGEQQANYRAKDQLFLSGQTMHAMDYSGKGSGKQ